MTETLNIVLGILGFVFGGGFLIFLAKSIFRLGELHQRFISLENKLDAFMDRVSKWSQTIVDLINKHEYRLLTLEYGKPGSSMVLKPEFRQFITKTKIDKQIEQKLPQLRKWLEEQKPPTGVDAQEKIVSLVTSEEIENYLDLKQYKQYFYEYGKTKIDAMGILTVYLFEALIPKIKFTNKGKDL